MKVSDIITYIAKIMEFDFKKIRSSSFRNIQKSVKKLRFKLCLERCGDKAGWFTRSQKRKYTKLSWHRNMILSSIPTLLKINLSYLELFD